MNLLSWMLSLRKYSGKESGKLKAERGKLKAESGKGKAKSGKPKAESQKLKAESIISFNNRYLS